jgi:hypothetical protein
MDQNNFITGQCDQQVEGLPVIDPGYSSYPASPSCTNEIAYFVVTHVACNGLPDDKMVQGTNDRLGYWVNPEHTRIVQTGLKHSLVPDVACFLLKGLLPDSSVLKLQ